MNGNDTALDKEAVSGDAQSGVTAPERRPPSAKYSTRLAREREAKAIREELDRGLSATEICAKYGWTHSTYYRRLRLAEKMGRDEYDPERAFMIFLKHEARYRRLQHEAEAMAAEIRRDLSQRAGDGANLREKAALATALAGLLRLIGDCEAKISKCAKVLGIKAAESDGEKRWTFAEFARAATIEGEEEERKNAEGADYKGGQ